MQNRSNDLWQTRIPRRLWMSAAAVMTVALASTTRGHVHGPNGEPLANADVVLARGDSVVRWGKTDADGYFWLVHQPLAAPSYQLLICARGMMPISSDRLTLVTLRADYGTVSRPTRFPGMLRASGWNAMIPTSCPPEGVTASR